MKLLPLASLSLISTLVLSGCASTLSLEEQTKLIEYEKCLSLASEILIKNRERVFQELPNLTLEQKIELGTIENEEFNATFEEMPLRNCKKYRP